MVSWAVNSLNSRWKRFLSRSSAAVAFLTCTPWVKKTSQTLASSRSVITSVNSPGRKPVNGEQRKSTLYCRSHWQPTCPLALAARYVQTNCKHKRVWNYQDSSQISDSIIKPSGYHFNNPARLEGLSLRAGYLPTD